MTRIYVHAQLRINLKSSFACRDKLETSTKGPRHLTKNLAFSHTREKTFVSFLKLKLFVANGGKIKLEKFAIFIFS